MLPWSAPIEELSRLSSRREGIFTELRDRGPGVWSSKNVSNNLVPINPDNDYPDPIRRIRNTPLRPQHFELVEPTQSIACETDCVSVSDRSTHAAVPVRDASISAQSSFFCDPVEHEEMKRRIEQLQSEKLEALQNVHRVELRVQELELKTQALQSDALYYAKLAECYSDSCDTLRASHEQSVRMIYKLLQALLQRTEEMQLLTKTLADAVVFDEVNLSKPTDALTHRTDLQSDVLWDKKLSKARQPA
ncbi:unnamed protein product [Echinostoma caproni]|uniref:Endosome-associated-trafficking regulator 1 n=1 Tax=Echinostoma caproni TaxID=27848 RepID=A0A183AJG1_9TREM|nr:unnamed protein product [Echinostoma caproni]